MNEIFLENLALEEVRLLYQKYDADANQLDAKAGNMLSSSSLILTLFGILQITLMHPQHTLLYRVLVGGVFVIFLAFVILVLLAMFPMGYKTVFVENWDGLEKAILGYSEDQQAARQMIGNYLDRINHNKGINQKKARYLQASTLVFAILMILIVSLSLFTQR